jgi:hypothetical protein
MNEIIPMINEIVIDNKKINRVLNKVKIVLGY